MRRVVFMLVFMVGASVLVTGGLGFAGDTKIGIIDMEKIMKESKAAKEARGMFLMDIESKRNVLKTKENEIRTMEDKLKKKEAGKATGEFKEERENISREIKELKRLRDDMEEELKKKELELQRKLFTEIKGILDEFSKKEKYSIIFEKKEALVFDESADITGQIIELYDSKKK